MYKLSMKSNVLAYTECLMLERSSSFTKLFNLLQLVILLIKGSDYDS